MGLFDGIRQALGIAAEADATRAADPEDLWGMSTAHVTMHDDLCYEPAGEAALCFANVDSTAFDDTVEEVMDLFDVSEIETGTEVELHKDTHGYHWYVLRDGYEFEDLVTSVHFAADTFVEREFGSRLLAAVFAFEPVDGGSYVYWIYSFRRGAYYPFAPAGSRERDERVEFKLRSVLDGELDLEPDKEYWYPLWPDDPRSHPWDA